MGGLAIDHRIATRRGMFFARRGYVLQVVRGLRRAGVLVRKAMRLQDDETDLHATYFTRAPTVRECADGWALLADVYSSIPPSSPDEHSTNARLWAMYLTMLASAEGECPGCGKWDILDDGGCWGCRVMERLTSEDLGEPANG